MSLLEDALNELMSSTVQENQRCFETDIMEMNKMYDLPANEYPTLKVGEPLVERLQKFKRVLTKELSEIDAIIHKANCFNSRTPYYDRKEGAHPAIIEPGTASHMVDELELLTDIADLMGDIQVYAVSEMCKFGIPYLPVLRVIMDSNFSKLDENGNPIKDEDGKFLKGPNYWKPETQIREGLQAMLDEQKENLEKAEKAIEVSAATLGAFGPLPTSESK
jgi:predicted HAD superfamily Cof-like phosphohydrolase